MGWGSFWLICAIPAFVGSALLTQFLIGWASRVGVLDRPNARSSHTKVTPRGGGLSIVLFTTIAGLASAALWTETRVPLIGLVAASLAIALVSWRDDLKPLPNRVRFVVHVIAAATVTYVAGPIQTIDLGGLRSLDLGPAAWPLTLLWIVGMTNAFNFMDGIDGIAGITAASAGAAITIAATGLASPAVAAVGCGLAASSLGFLTCNWPPARIFMGDVGSAFCGFLIAALPMLPAPASRLLPVALFAMWPFIFDTIFTLGRRLARAEPIFQPHRSHIYQRLVVAGWSHRATTILYGMLSAFAVAISLVSFLGESASPSLTILSLTFLPASATLLVVSAHRAGIMQP